MATLLEPCYTIGRPTDFVKDHTGVPRSSETDPAAALCLGTYGGPRGVGVSEN